MLLFQWGVTGLRDNLPGHKYHFKMSVYTGLRKDAGTKSNICFTLAGDYEETPVRVLSDATGKVSLTFTAAELLNIWTPSNT